MLELEFLLDRSTQLDGGVATRLLEKQKFGGSIPPRVEAIEGAGR